MAKATITNPGAEFYGQNGYAVVRGIYDRETTDRLRNICERVLDQWRRAPLSDNPPVGPQANYMRHLNNPDYHRDHPDDLAFLLNAIGEPRVHKTIQQALDEEFFFAHASLYFNPTGESQDGFWHKDGIGNEAEIPRIRETGAGLHMQIALVPTNDLEVVPGSHLRDYTPEERAICVEEDGVHNRSNNMLGAVRMSLEPGDAAMFSQICVHRGRYHTDKLRRTVMISVKKKVVAEHTLRKRGLTPYSDQPWFLLPDYLKGVNPLAQSFFQEFVDFYAPHWRARLSETLKYTNLIRTLEQSGAPYPFFLQ